MPSKTIRKNTSMAKPSAPVQGNGRDRPILAPAKTNGANGRSEIPLAGDFKDF
jgi:hypothetical protein